MNSSTRVPASPSEAEVFTVSRLNREARIILETGLPMLWVAGEISNLAQPGSGHIYFSLKDAQAQIQCAMFRSANRQVRFKPANGTQVVVRAKVSLYEARGTYQLIVEQMEAAGEGLLRQQLEELKNKLSAEGLFTESHKQQLPALPRRIGIITSPTGAAVRDILHILARRYPAAAVIIYPTRVQGAQAVGDIVAAIQLAEQRAECDVLIIARGGGSLEDLWCFNDETVARTIYACSLPVISGVGHEVDFTICDLVADVRAPTPSAAAELVVPDREDLLKSFRATDRRALIALQQLCTDRLQRSKQLDARLTRMHPDTVLRQMEQRTDELTRQLGKVVHNYLQYRRMAHAETYQRLRATTPLEKIRRQLDRSLAQQRQMAQALTRRLAAVKSRLAVAAGSLNTVSPLATLERGYAIVKQPGTDKVLTSTRQLKAGDPIEARLADGRLLATVSKLLKD